MSHIGLNNDSSDFEELICDGCMKAHPFLWQYNSLAKEKETVDGNVDVTSVAENGEPTTKKARLEDVKKNPDTASREVSLFFPFIESLRDY